MGIFEGVDGAFVTVAEATVEIGSGTSTAQKIKFAGSLTLELWANPQFNNPRSFAIGRILRTSGRTPRSVRDLNSADGDARSG
jgi:hypothetical protein